MSTDQQSSPAPEAGDVIDLIPTEAFPRPFEDDRATKRIDNPSPIGEASQGSLAAETHDLRRRRLAAAALFMAGATTALLTWSLFTGTLYMHRGVALIKVARVIVSVGAAALLYSRKPLTASTVKGIEYGLFGLMILLLGMAEYLVSIEYLRQGDALAMATYMKNGVIGAMMLMLLYGALIPNDAASAAKVVLSMAVVPVIAFTLLMEYEHPELIRELETMRSPEHAGSNVLALLCGAALAIYAAHILNGLRKDLHDARKFGQYQLGRKIGVGGMGEVYMAEHQMLKRPAALKLIKGDDGADPLAVARFEREVKSAARLSHPNTIAIYDYGRTEDGTFYYVMEYLPGMTLQDLVKQHGPLPGGRLIYLLRQICGGLAEAHTMGIVHRDLKPANVFVALRGGEADVAKILDFGLVKLTDPSAPELTTDHSVSGTPAFMAPEQATGDAPVDGRTDVYALGAIAYYALTGKTPFHGTSAMSIMISQVRDPVVPPSKIQGDVPEDLEQVILKCLAKDPNERYQNAKAMARALTSCTSAADWNEEKAEAWWQSQVQPVVAQTV